MSCQRKEKPLSIINSWRNVDEVILVHIVSNNYVKCVSQDSAENRGGQIVAAELAELIVYCQTKPGGINMTKVRNN